MWAEHTLLIWELVILNWMWRVACEEVALLLAATINKLITTLLHYWLIDIEGASVWNSEMYWMHLTGGFPQNRGTIEVGRSCGGGYEWVEGYLPSKDICNGRISIIRIGKRHELNFQSVDERLKSIPPWDECENPATHRHLYQFTYYATRCVSSVCSCLPRHKERTTSLTFEQGFNAIRLNDISLLNVRCDEMIYI